MKSVAILGAGASGLRAIKCCLDEGLKPVCFEQHAAIGGIWNYSEEPRSNQGAASFWSLVTNTSKEPMAFSDFPMPEDYPQHMPHTLFLEYLKNFAKHFDLEKHIQFNTRVIKVSKAFDFETTGRWEVETERDNSKESNIYDAVLVCVGLDRFGFIPDIDGLYTEFKGEVLHTHSYRTNSKFKNKTVLVVGNQNSAGDAAADVSHVAKQVYWSVGKGTTLLSRYQKNHLPADITQNRFLTKVINLFPAVSRVLGRIVRTKMGEAVINHSKYGISTKETLDPFHGGAYAVNDELKFKIMSGKVKCRGNLVRLSDKDAHFADDTVTEGIDVILFGTGYKPDLSFIDDEIIKGLGQNRLDWPVYKWVHPIHLPHPTLSLIAFTRVGGALMGLMELHCRWATAVINGNITLPSVVEMNKYQAQVKQMFQRRCNGKFQPLYSWLLEINAEEIGACPSFWQLFWRSPGLAFKTLFGPIVPALYRITGYGSYPDGGENYLKIYNRIYNYPN